MNHIESLLKLAEKFDEEGKVKEADAIEGIIRTIAAEDEEKSAKNGLNGKTTKALQSLKRALESFCGKNLDPRGEHRRLLTKLMDTCEDMLEDCNTILGGE